VLVVDPHGALLAVGPRRLGDLAKLSPGLQTLISGGPIMLERQPVPAAEPPRGARRRSSSS
jgi:hypothetical protein